MLAIARQKLGGKAELYPGRAEELPFPDNEFDIVSLITTLEFTDDPAKAIGEAIRVSRGRVFLGVLSGCSFKALHRRFGGLFRPSFYRKARFTNIYGLTGIVRQ